MRRPRRRHGGCCGGRPREGWLPEEETEGEERHSYGPAIKQNTISIPEKSVIFYAKNMYLLRLYAIFVAKINHEWIIFVISI
jgi:hypothetical protein